MGYPDCSGDDRPLRRRIKPERITCPHCDSLLDVNQGNLTYLKALTPTAVDASFVLNQHRGDIQGRRQIQDHLGTVVRSVTIEGETYYWHEYLLYNPSIGFRWLVHFDNHWNFVEPVNVAEVSADANIFGRRSANV